METRAPGAGEPEPAAVSSSFHARLWKNLQLGVGKGKGGAGGRAGGPERRTADTPSPSPPPPRATRDALPGVGSSGSRWSGFKKRKQVLDRVFSSSQPNLCCSSPEPLEPGGAARAEQGSALRRRRIREHLLPTARGAAAGTPPGGRSPDSAPSSSSASSSLSSSPQPPPRGDRAGDAGARRRGPGAHLCHQKSSSLPGTACLEQLLQPPPPPAEPVQSPAEPPTPDPGEERGSSQARRSSLFEIISFPAKTAFTSIMYASYAALIYLAICINAVLEKIKNICEEEEVLKQIRESENSRKAFSEPVLSEPMFPEGEIKAKAYRSLPEKPDIPYHPKLPANKQNNKIQVLHSVFDQSAEMNEQI